MTAKSKTKTVSICLDEDTHAKIVKLAKADNRSLSNQVRRILKMYVGSNRSE